MAQFWKEPYTLQKALELDIRDFENAQYVGVPIICDWSQAFATGPNGFTS